jgi:hypothetical protein
MIRVLGCERVNEFEYSNVWGIILKVSTPVRRSRRGGRRPRTVQRHDGENYVAETDYA